MMARAQSAGVLMFRRRNASPEVLLVHPGGPFWQRKDDGAWSIPKGEFLEGEAADAAARREFAEETGCALRGELLPLTPVKQPSGKVVHPFAIEGELDPASISSNTFALEWPPRSGIMREFPEVDRAGWFTIADARHKLIAGQRPILDELESVLNAKT